MRVERRDVAGHARDGVGDAGDADGRAGQRRGVVALVRGGEDGERVQAAVRAPDVGRQPRAVRVEVHVLLADGGHPRPGEPRGEQVEGRSRGDEDPAPHRPQPPEQRHVGPQARVRVRVVLRVDEHARQPAEQAREQRAPGGAPLVVDDGDGRARREGEERRFAAAHEADQLDVAAGQSLGEVEARADRAAHAPRMEEQDAHALMAGARAGARARERRRRTQRQPVQRDRGAAEQAAAARLGARDRRRTRRSVRMRRADPHGEVVLDRVVRLDLQRTRAHGGQHCDVLLGGQAVEVGAEPVVADAQVPRARARAREQRELEAGGEAPVVQLRGDTDLLAVAPVPRDQARLGAGGHLAGDDECAALHAHTSRLGMRRQSLDIHLEPIVARPARANAHQSVPIGHHRHRQPEEGLSLFVFGGRGPAARPRRDQVGELDLRLEVVARGAQRHAQGLAAAVPREDEGVRRAGDADEEPAPLQDLDAPRDRVRGSAARHAPRVPGCGAQQVLSPHAVQASVRSE